MHFFINKIDCLPSDDSNYKFVYMLLFLFYFFETGSCLPIQAGAWWCDLGSNYLPSSASWVAGITGVCHGTWIVFCIFSRDRVPPYWPGWSWTPDLRWFAHFGLPKCWDYRCEPSCPARKGSLFAEKIQRFIKHWLLNGFGFAWGK